MRTIDTRGLSCPQPLVLSIRHSGKRGTLWIVLVDNEASL